MTHPIVLTISITRCKLRGSAASLSEAKRCIFIGDQMPDPVAKTEFSGAAPGAPQPGPTSPDSQPISHVTLVMGASEFLLSLGKSRAVFSPQAPTSPDVAIEWLMTAVLSPVVTKEIAQILTNAVTGYEQQFGPIPDTRKLAEIAASIP
jgi:hypothetical protein